MLPSRPWRICSGVGLGLVRRISCAAKIIPGVQKPHCNPCLAQNASCSGVSWPFSDRPSMVVTLVPSAWTASVVHDFTDIPSISTVQAPHWLVSHPIFVPVRPASRRKCTRSSLGSTSLSYWRPLTLMLTAHVMKILRRESANGEGSHHEMRGSRKRIVTFSAHVRVAAARRPEGSSTRGPFLRHHPAHNGSVSRPSTDHPDAAGAERPPARCDT